MRKTQENKKEVYWLWCEYLKRSQDYKEFCEWFEKRRKKKIRLPEKFRKDPVTGNASKEFLTFIHFGNVHKVSFNEWWAEFKRKLDYYKTDEGNTPKRIEHLSDLDKKRYPEYIYLKVRIEGEDPEDLRQSFTKIINEAKKKIERRIILYRKYRKTTTRVHAPELRKYLSVYDMRQKDMKYEDILKHTRPKPKGDIADQIRQLKSFNAKAKTIIKNVERGLFPGPYTYKRKRGES
jgi:hypothetical protein